MTSVGPQQIIEQIHNSAHKLVFEFTGAGSLALYQLHSVAGSSRTPGFRRTPQLCTRNRQMGIHIFSRRSWCGWSSAAPSSQRDSFG